MSIHNHGDIFTWNIIENHRVFHYLLLFHLDKGHEWERYKEVNMKSKKEGGWKKRWSF
jgi:hypothetical protein